jgi:hypothetical protein
MTTPLAVPGWQPFGPCYRESCLKYPIDIDSLLLLGTWM